MAKNLGADVFENSRQDPPAPADVVIDLVAGPDTGKYVEQLNANGRYVIAGIAAGMPSANLASTLIEHFRRSLSIATLSLDTVPDHDLNSAAEQIFADVEAGRLTPVVAATFPLEEAEQAHQLLAKGGLLGKIILRL